MNPQCIFCKIVSGEAQAHILYQDELVTAFFDLRPITPVHILVVPNRHIESINQAAASDEILLGHMLMVARNLALEQHLNNSGYRLVINTGPDAGQSIYHLHLHLIGGRHMPFHFRE
jgi:histidine triad (HIT) family protein